MFVYTHVHMYVYVVCVCTHTCSCVHIGTVEVRGGRQKKRGAGNG